MKSYFRVLLLLSLIGGGFTGITLLAKTAFTSNFSNPYIVLLTLFFLGLYVVGIYAGFKIIEGADIGLKLSKLFFMMQIPVLSSKYVVYQFTSGFICTVSLNITNEKLSIFPQIGSLFSLYILPDKAPLSFGINFFAVFMVWGLWKLTRSSIKPALNS